MIKSKSDYFDFLERDLEQADYENNIKSLLFNEIYRYLRLLRKEEYLVNCKSDFLSKLYRVFTHYRRKKLGNKLGFSIPVNVFGPGLSIAHVGPIVVNPKTRVGVNCRIHICVNIGAAKEADIAPVLGDDIYIGPGVKMYGGIKLGNNIDIGANAVVNKNFEKDNCVLAGVPAKIIRDKNESE